MFALFLRLVPEGRERPGDPPTKGGLERFRKLDALGKRGLRQLAIFARLMLAAL